LTRIKSNAFSSCSSLKSITIPRSAQILCSECFSHCHSLSSISFETDSELTCIEARACAMTYLSFVIVPENTLFIAGDPVPRSCTVTLVGSDSNAAFGAWNRDRQLGSSDSFK
jgi:hypothetical protein